MKIIFLIVALLLLPLCIRAEEALPDTSAVLAAVESADLIVVATLTEYAPGSAMNSSPIGLPNSAVGQYENGNGEIRIWNQLKGADLTSAVLAVLMPRRLENERNKKDAPMSMPSNTMPAPEVSCVINVGQQYLFFLKHLPEPWCATSAIRRLDGTQYEVPVIQIYWRTIDSHHSLYPLTPTLLEMIKVHLKR